MYVCVPVRVLPGYYIQYIHQGRDEAIASGAQISETKKQHACVAQHVCVAHLY